MKRIILLSFIAFGWQYSEHKSNIGNSQEKSVHPKEYISIGFWREFENLPKLEFKESDSKNFAQAQGNHPVVPIGNINSVSHEIISNVKHILNPKTCSFEEKGFCLSDFLPNQKYYLGESYYVGESIGFGERYIIDSLSNKFYQLVSIGDGSVSAPVISPNNEYLVYYFNGFYQGNICDVRVLKINSKEDSDTLFSEYRHGFIEDFYIDSIKWSDDNTIEIIGQEEYMDSNDEIISNTKYYQTSFAKD